MTHLSSTTYLTSLASDVARMTALLTGSSVWTAPVPGCPEWDVEALVRHVGHVHQRNATIVDADVEWPTEPEGTDGLAEWLATGGDRLVHVLDVDPSTPATTWNPADQTVGFLQRRLALETVVHRIDLEDALSSQTPVAPELAADGVSEVVDLLIPRRVSGGRLVLLPYSIRLQARDTGDQWTLGTGELEGTAEAAADTLLRRLWHRPAPAELHVTGHADEVLAFLDQQLTA